MYNMAKKLDPFEKYQRTFLRKMKTLENTLGPIGKDCFQKFGIPTTTRLFNDHFKECVSNMKKEIWRLEQEERIMCRLQAEHRKYHWLWKYKDEISAAELNVHARDLASAIYDLPMIPTGYVSVRMLEQGGKRTDEHFNPRQWAGHVIMEYIYMNEGIDLETLRKFADVFRQVHHTTAEENSQLRAFQIPGKYETWEKSYEDAGITLVKEKDKGPVLSIDSFWSPVNV